MGKAVKNLLISGIADRVGDEKDFLVIDSSKLDAINENKFRAALREKGVGVFAVRNALARRALNDLGVDALNPVLAGPSTLVWGGEDVVELSKEITKWSKDEERIEVKGGTVEGNTLSPDDIIALSKSPGRMELIGEIITLATSPARAIAGALLGPARTIAGQAKSIADKEE